jgi:hypothetical protein
VRDFRNGGGQHVAGAAPLCPEIDHDGLRVARRQNFGFEVSIVYRLDAIIGHVLCPQGLTGASAFSLLTPV